MSSFGNNDSTVVAGDTIVDTGMCLGPCSGELITDFCMTGDGCTTTDDVVVVAVDVITCVCPNLV